MSFPHLSGWRTSITAVLVGCGFGCGSQESMQPKTQLNADEQQQLRELDKQRQQEWGTTGKKPR